MLPSSASSRTEIRRLPSASRRGRIADVALPKLARSRAGTQRHSDAQRLRTPGEFQQPSGASTIALCSRGPAPDPAPQDAGDSHARASHVVSPPLPTSRAKVAPCASFAGTSPVVPMRLQPIFRRSSTGARVCLVSDRVRAVSRTSGVFAAVATMALIGLAAWPAQASSAAPEAPSAEEREVGQPLVGRVSGSQPSSSLLQRVRAGQLGGVIVFSDNHCDSTRRCC